MKTPRSLHRNGTSPGRWSLVAMLIVLGLASVTHAGFKRNDFSVNLDVGWQGHCRPGRWTPLQIIISSRAQETLIGSVEITNVQDGQHRMFIQLQRPVIVLPGQTVRVQAITKLGLESETCRITLREAQSGKVLFGYDFHLMDYGRNRPGPIGLDLVMPHQILVGISGSRRLNIPKPIAQEATVTPINELKPEFYAGYIPTLSLPTSWTGYDALDALVLYNPDWSQFNLAQDKALAEWVSNGGQLLVFLGTKPIRRDSAIGRLIPFKIAEPQQMTIPAEVLGKWHVESASPVDLPVWTLPKASSLPVGWQVLEQDVHGRPIRIAGQVGFGRIILCGFDPKSLIPKAGEQRRDFWQVQLQPMLDPNKIDPELREKIRQGLESWQYENVMTPQSSSLNYVLTYLVGIGQLEPISVWWVLGILGTMAILIGPVDYMVLKRRKRLPWTYVTFTAILAVFTIGAYYGVRYLRGGHNQLRRISVLDKIDGTDHCWQSGYTGIFASRSGDYKPVGIRSGSWWSGITPAVEHYGFSRRNRVRSTIACLQQDGNIPAAVPINIWSMRTMMDEGRGGDFPIEVKVDRHGADVRALITNTGQAPVSNGVLRVREGCLPFRRIEPGQTITVEGRPQQGRHFNFLEGNKPHYRTPEQLWFGQVAYDRSSRYEYKRDVPICYRLVLAAEGCSRRTQAIEQRINQGAAVVYAAVEDAPADITLEKHNAEIIHTALIRLVIPKI